MLGRSLSVRVRLTLWNVSIVALVLLVLGVAVRYTSQGLLLASKDEELVQRAQPMAEDRAGRGGPGGPGPFGPPPGPPPEWQSARKQGLGPGQQAQQGGPPGPNPGTPGVPPGPPPPRRPMGKDPFARFRPRFVDTRGRSLDPWDKTVAWDYGLVRRSARGEKVFATIEVDGERVRVLSIPIRRQGKIVGVLQMASSLADIDRALAGVARTLLIVVPLALVACGLTGAFLTSRAMRPVRDITRASARIGATNRSDRLPVVGDDEFARLAATINGMLGRLDDAFTRLEAAFEQQRRFTADASHELRSPLTTIKGNASLALLGERSAADYRKALEATDRAADAMNRIVQDLLLLARSDAGQLPMAADCVPVLDILTAAREAIQTASAPAVDIRVQERQLAVRGDRSHLVRVVSNLLQNAVRHTPATGGIALGAVAQGDEVVIQVADTGEGIAPEHLPHVCERFYRVDKARARAHGGTGLGLAICQSIVAAHGGSMQIDSAVDEGTTVTVRLPRAVPVPPAADPAGSPAPVACSLPP